MPISKVVYGGNTLIDLTEDTITSDTILEGYTAHDKSGNKLTGTCKTITVYSGTAEPTSDIGEDGDIYLVTE